MQVIYKKFIFCVLESKVCRLARHQHHPADPLLNLGPGVDRSDGCMHAVKDFGKASERAGE